MPNPVLTKAIDRLASREDLPAADAAAVLAEIMAGNASEPETAAVLIALRTKGETVDELVGLAGTMRRFATPVMSPRPPGRPHRHRGHRRRAADVQRLDHGRPDRGRRGLRRGQARQPLRHGAVGLGRRARGAGRADRPDARGGRGVHPRGGLRLHVRPGAPRRDPPRRAGAQGARRAHDLQLPRPAHEPRRRHAAGDRRVRRPLPGRDGRRARPPGRPQGDDRLQRRRPRRAQHERRHPRGRGRRRRAAHLRGDARGGRAAARGLRGRGRRHARTSTPRRPGASSRASGVRSGTSPCSTPGRRSTSPGARTRWKRACGPRRPRVDDGGAARALDSLVRVAGKLAAS